MKRKKKGIRLNNYVFTSGTVIPQRISYSTISDPDSFLDTVKIYYQRRIQWQDLRKAVQNLANELKNVLITMKDFLLIRSRSFSQNSASTSTSSTSGYTVKLLPSSSGTMKKARKKR